MSKDYNTAIRIMGEYRATQSVGQVYTCSNLIIQPAENVWQLLLLTISHLVYNLTCIIPFVNNGAVLIFSKMYSDPCMM